MHVEAYDGRDMAAGPCQAYPARKFTKPYSSYLHISSPGIFWAQVYNNLGGALHALGRYQEVPSKR